MSDEVVFRCVEVVQPIGTFYVGAMKSQDVLAIAAADVRRIEARDIEKIVGVQRELSASRKKELQKYVRNVDATFPTSVILAVSDEHARYDKRTQTMKLSRQDGIARIIDGQHRIGGLEGFDGQFDVVVTVFVDMDIQDQAMTFAVINISQTKVNKSLVYDLFEFQRHRSPQKTCHNIARLLNLEDNSPLQGRIKILGKAEQEEPFEFITQATFVESLLPYITKDAMLDRDALRRGQAISPASPSDAARLIFRDLFINGKDEAIANIIWNYFDAVQRKWPTAWNSQEKGNVLNRTTGFRGLMRFLAPVYRAAGKAGKLTVEAVGNILKGIRLKDSEFSTDRFKPGTSGESALFRQLREQGNIE